MIPHPPKMIMPNPQLPLKVKFAHEIGTRISLRRYWNDPGTDNAHGQKYGYHNCHNYLENRLHPLILGNREHFGGQISDYDESLWPTKCDECGTICPPDAKKQVFNSRLYDTPSGEPEPGSLWFAHWLPLDTYFDNQTRFILYAVVPNGEHWCIDSRAENCGLKQDRLHRCWVVHGNPEDGTIHVDKNGLTCPAGAGSIGAKNWHGFLHHGEFHI